MSERIRPDDWPDERLLGLRRDYDRDGLRSCVDLVDLVVEVRTQAQAELERLRG